MFGRKIMVANSIGQSNLKSEHARWRDDHLAWAAEVQLWETTLDAVLFDIELALWATQHTKLDRCSPLEDLERMYIALNDLAAALREHGDKIREHQAALIQHRRQLATVQSSDASDAATPGHRIMAVVHDEQRVFRERFRECFDVAMREIRCLLETRSGAH